MIITCPHCHTKLQVGPGHGRIVCPNCRKDAATIATESEASLQGSLLTAQPAQGAAWPKFVRHGLFVCLAVASGLCFMGLISLTGNSEQSISTKQQLPKHEVSDSQPPIAQQKTVTSVNAAPAVSPQRENAMLRAELVQLQSTWNEMVSEQ